MDEPEDPLFVSVRSGAAVSMPGIMDTVLNLGLNGTSVEGLARRTGDERCARDSYRRFIQMFGDIVFKIDLDKFEAELDDLKKERGVEEDTGLGAEDLKGLIDNYSGLQ
jgi:pyruvate, orthophosphate dikinase